MTNPPTGRLLPTGGGADLIVSRTFPAPLEDVWASVTESDRTSRWFGAWKGDAGPGRTIQVQMAFEEQAPWLDVRINACDPPRRLAVTMAGDGPSGQRLELLLTPAADRTEVRLVHHLDDTGAVGEMGPGWEYYLDMLAAARDDRPAPSFDDYYPAMKGYYDGLRP